MTIHPRIMPMPALGVDAGADLGRSAGYWLVTLSLSVRRRRVPMQIGITSH